MPRELVVRFVVMAWSDAATAPVAITAASRKGQACLMMSLIDPVAYQRS
jgi:hypothetical protein